MLEEREASNLAMPAHQPNSQAGELARNLRESQLGGVIFGCKHDTIGDYLRQQLFGLPSIHYSYVRNIKPGMPLFLFNYSNRKLHGVFEAASPGQMFIDPYAWSKDGSLRTAFPAQVRICTKTQYPPLLESQFITLLGDNYYDHHHFYFELDHAQTRALVSLFKSSAPANLNQVPAISSKWSLGVSSPRTKRKASSARDPKEVTANSKNPTNSFSILSNASDVVPGNWADSDEKESTDDLDDSVLENKFGRRSNPDDVSQKSSDKALDKCNHPVNKQRGSFDESILVNSHNEHTCAVDVDEIGGRVHDNLVTEGMHPERLTILSKLKELSFLRNQAALSSQDCVDSCSDQCVPEEPEVNADLSCGPYSAAMEDNTLFDECLANDEVIELLQIITDLTKRTEAIEQKQSESGQDILSLRDVVKDSGTKVQQLEHLVDDLQFKFDSSLSHHGSMCTNLAKPSIFLIGGYNGVNWLSCLDSFSPDKDVLLGLTPMGSARSYASAAALDGHIFTCGGGDGRSWYNTVECYSAGNNEWTECPLLKHKKGSLAAISLKEKIYAIGGGDGDETFSEVEMFDPYLGKWICGPSMLLSRFALAAAELNGVIYTTGGFDGSMYLESAERYDPREGLWVRLPNMNTRRGCHALTVMGEALYAMGGYDGEKMVLSVEIYDPRLNAWRMVDPLNTPRGYAAGVNLDDSLILIGGMQSSAQILDTVEVYSASSGWSVLSFSSIGKRSFASAVVM